MNPPVLPNGSSQPQVQATSFHLVLLNYKAKLTDQEKRQFQGTEIEDLQLAIKKIQDKHESEKGLRAMYRLNAFLEGMKEYDKVIQIFVNTSEILAFVWGPMKFLLQIACTFADAFNILLEAYQRIGEHLPLLAQYEQLFRDQPQMARVLTLMYEDILNFHWKAMSYFKKRMWAKLFSAVWKTFGAEFDNILANLKAHRELIESQASLVEYSEIVKTRELAKTALDKFEEAETQRRRDHVYQWLSAALFEADQATCEKIRHKYPGTGSWLLKKDRFHSWFDPDLCAHNLLWLNGIPGAGKTILASLVIEEAKKLRQSASDISLAYFYCRYQDETRDSFLAVARGIIAQLLQQDDSLLPYLYEKASRSGQTTLSTAALAQELLDTAIKNSEKLYVVIDGLDECGREERRDIVIFFESACEALPMDDMDTLRCMFISQDDSAARNDFAKMVSIKISTSDIEHDIRSFARTESLRVQTRFDLSPERQQFVEDMLTGRADGMFLFAKLMSSYLLDQTSVGRLDEELAPGIFPSGPSRLTELYSRIMKRLSRRDDIIKLLAWFVCARRPFKWREVQCAVSIDLEEQTVEWERDRICVDPKDLFGSLVDVQADDTVNLIHYTAKRYLIDSRSVDPATAELALTLRSVGYLSFPGFDPVCTPALADMEILFKDRMGYYGFVDYAYSYWSRHLEKAVATPRTDGEIQELAEVVGTFIDLHWAASNSPVPTPKSIQDRLKVFKNERNFEKLACAVHLGRKYLHAASGVPAAEEKVLRLDDHIGKIRKVAESLRSDGTSIWKRYEKAYGKDVYKCPRLNCTRFYNGFPTSQLRDEHVPKHERSFFCSFPGCHIALLGCATLKELQKHERDFHEALELDEEVDFPELPAEKVSFNCSHCGQKFTRKHNLKIHERTHNSSDEKLLFPCGSCGKSFARQGDRTRHMSTFHIQPKSFICGGDLQGGAKWGCGRTFNRADILNRHYKSVTGRACRLPLEEEEAASTSTSTPSSSQMDLSQMSGSTLI